MTVAAYAVVVFVISTAFGMLVGGDWKGSLLFAGAVVMITQIEWARRSHDGESDA